MAQVNQVERASRAWPILAAVAKDKRTITYGALAGALGIHHRPIRYVLGLIQDYCLSEQLPPLTILVVSQSGEPGTGFIAHRFDDLAAGYEAVWEYNWNSLENPFEFSADGTSFDELTKRLVQDPSDSEEVYAKVKSRGVKQLLFRSAVLRAYRHKCAFTEISFPEALEACHIIPWSQASGEQRLDVRNGILLNSFHHKLFDRGLITFTEDHEIHYFDPRSEEGEYSKMDELLTSRLHGKKLYLPFQKKQRPLAEYVKRHHEIQGWNI
ncbi:HNH endonuclease [Saccharospirillum alexandrii]|uniref:HNH endonuclease n=1 Tax=Saccharospirillum alexandrii TaxID=2448477 RepID=UPI000FD9AD1C|nr:HNH endonuclease [Saccharospirillum alexandrii]